MRICSSCSARGCGTSIRSCSQWRSSGSWMCMYSVPTVRQYESRSTPRMSRSFISGLAAEAAGGELALQVPQRQPVQVDVQVGMLALGDLERVGVGHQVPAHPVGVDQLLHPGGPGDVVLVPLGEVPDPADRLVRDAQRGEDLVVEAVLAEQQLVDLLQELPGLRALDDPVVVGRGERDRLADRQPGQGLLGRARRTRPGTPSPRRRRCRPGRASAWGTECTVPIVPGLVMRRGGALEVVDRELARPRPPHDVLVARPEHAEVHLLRRLDVRHQELPGCRRPPARRWPAPG